MFALGITAMVLAIISTFIPVVGIYLPIFAGLLAAFSAKKGFPFGMTAITVNIINVIFLSPLLWVAAGVSEMEKSGSGGDFLAGAGAFLIGAQIVFAVILIVFNKMQQKRS